MLKNITKWPRWSLLLYLITLITVSVMPLGKVSKEITNITVIHLRGDYFLHMLVYLPILMLMVLSFQKWKWGMLVVALLLGAGLEFIQMALPYRAFNINDLLANVGGVVIGAGVAYAYKTFTRIKKSFLNSC